MRLAEQYKNVNKHFFKIMNNKLYYKFTSKWMVGQQRQRSIITYPIIPLGHNIQEGLSYSKNKGLAQKGIMEM